VFKIPERVSCTQSVGTRWIIVAPLLRSGWCCGYLLTDVVVDFPSVNRLLTCTWGSSGELLLSPNSSGYVGVLALLPLFFCLAVLRRYICRNDQDLAIFGFELFSQIVRGDSGAGDLERKAIRRYFLVQSAAMSYRKRSAKLLEDTALAHRVFGLLVDRAGFVEVIPAAFTILRVGSRFDLDLVLHVV
jgi:hypothetical protein